MRHIFFQRLLLLTVVGSLSFCVSGCANQAEPEGPELGSVEAYLQEHPEERLDDPDEAGSEEEEFEAGS